MKLVRGIRENKSFASVVIFSFYNTGEPVGTVKQSLMLTHLPTVIPEKVNNIIMLAVCFPNIQNRQDDR